MYKKAIEEARILMKKQTDNNKAPSWLTTELAQKVGKELALEYNVNPSIVQLTLYLQHLVFDRITGGEIQKNHPKLSAQFVEKNNLLNKWNIPKEDQTIIMQAIRTHHCKEKSDNLIIEVIKNAECQKFVTKEGALIWLHELGIREYDFEKAKELVFYKMNQKKELLTLDKCRILGEQNCMEIQNMFLDNKKIEKLKKLHQSGIEKKDYYESIKEIGIIEI